ncbi:MAG TPA: hemolysin family protein [Cyclobacteriaceae bacterium]|nr:hemolysin family protein [Cyclobacteriaceae bacterium]
MDTDLILPAVLTLLFFSFFAGVEVAFQSCNKLQIELQGKHGILGGKIFSYFIKKISYFNGTILIGKLLSLVSFVFFVTRLLNPLIKDLPAAFNNNVVAMLIVSLTSVVLILFFAEFLSKNIFLINPNRCLKISAIPFLVIHILLLPLVSLTFSLSRALIKMFKPDFPDEKPVFSLTDINRFIKDTQQAKDEEDTVELETKIFHNAMEFKSVRVRECMIPRTEIVAIEIDEGIKKLKEAFVESGHSKIIIYRETIDDVIGFCHSSELFKKPETIEEILTPIISVPETTLANELMIKFIDERKSLAVVLDEFGGTSGLVSMEDVIEEIFGEIEDEHDEDHLTEQKIDERTYLLSARLEVDYLNEAYQWHLPEGDYETLSGLILAYTENIPKPGDKVSVPPYSFVIQSTLDNRIDIVMMVIEQANE